MFRRKALHNAREFILLSVLTLIMLSVVFQAGATPEGATPTLVSSGTRSAQQATTSRSDAGGQFVYVNLSSTQTQGKWKAYVGNVSGTLVLADGNGYSIYEWALTSTITGEVYATRNNSISWSNVTCASTEPIFREDAFLNQTHTASDSINRTFSLSYNHTATAIGTTTVSNCTTVLPFVNNTAQTNSPSNIFPEFIIGANDTLGTNSSNQTDANHLVFVVGIAYTSTTISSYNNQSTFDFEMIVPDSSSESGAIPYYFYLEID
ncbi:hypothetical protein J4475_02910 [Candidatus Woesearchaeota archaeon]|nr:hypothetical protein [Candidatus Woesearchaeota archaeon]